MGSQSEPWTGPQDEVQLDRPDLAEVFHGEQDDPDVVVHLLDLGPLGTLTDVLGHQRMEAQDRGHRGEVGQRGVRQIDPDPGPRVGERGGQLVEGEGTAAAAGHGTDHRRAWLARRAERLGRAHGGCAVPLDGAGCNPWRPRRSRTAHLLRPSARPSSMLQGRRGDQDTLHPPHGRPWAPPRSTFGLDTAVTSTHIDINRR
jgi:hypothetical protein